jgi:hypothetical protein
MLKAPQRSTKVAEAKDEMAKLQAKYDKTV